MKRIVLSLGMLAFAGAATWGATGAFFSDVETSTANAFVAGDIDLQIDNESYIQATSTQGSGPSNLLAWAATSWTMADLQAGVQKFFDFTDLKPGDLGEDTISIHVGSNNAYLCAAARITDDSDQTLTEPELADDLATSSFPGAELGDLDAGVNFVFWADDGDNVLETGENVFLSGPLSGLDSEGQIALADTSGDAPFGASVAGGSTIFIGKAWCFGALGAAPIVQDGLGTTTNQTNGPLVRGTGVTCDGASASNAAQTDRVQGDMQFYAVQSRNNTSFTCDEDYDPTWPALEEVLQ